jgi:hypothetical protein
MPLEGEGTISHRVDKYVPRMPSPCHLPNSNHDTRRLYTTLTKNNSWMADLRAADVIFVATHSQGSIVSTHLLDRLIRDGYVRPPTVPGSPSAVAASAQATAAGVSGAGAVGQMALPQRICCVALCGIHMGPLRYLNSSSMIKPYFQVSAMNLMCARGISYAGYSTSSPQQRWSCLSFRRVYFRVALALASSKHGVEHRERCFKKLCKGLAKRPRPRSKLLGEPLDSLQG